MSSPWVRVQRLQFGVPTYNPRTQTDIIINLWASCSSGVMLILLLYLMKLRILLSLGLGWPGLLQGLNSFKICPLSYLWCHRSCTQSNQSGLSRSGQCPDSLGARSEACSALSLKPEQDYLYNLPNCGPASFSPSPSVWGWVWGTRLGAKCSCERRRLSSTDFPGLEWGSYTDILRLREGAPQGLRGCDRVSLVWGIGYAQACTIINRASLKNKNDFLITHRWRAGSSKSTPWKDIWKTRCWRTDVTDGTPFMTVPLTRAFEGVAEKGRH